MGIEAVIFDLDGTLIDSRLRSEDAKRDFLRNLRDRGIDPGRISPRRPAEIIITYLERYRSADRKFLMKVLEESFEPYEAEAVEKARLKTGVREVLGRLKAIGCGLGLASNNSRRSVERILRKFDLEELFNAVVSRNDVRRLKPHEEPILKALKILGSAPWRTLYVGDTAIDVIAGRRAGVHVATIADRWSPSRGPADGYAIRDLASVFEVIRILEERSF